MTTRPFGSRLLGAPDQSGAMLRWRVQVLLTASLVLANLIGAVIVVALIILVIPGPTVFAGGLSVISIVLVPVYVGLAVLIGIVWGTARALRTLRWAFEHREPDERDRRATLSVPWRLTRMQSVLWLVAAVLFSTISLLINPDSVFKVAFTVSFGGIVVCANSYMLSEFALRPFAARALSSGPPLQRRMVSRVSVRIMLAWALGSGIPIAGLMVVALFSLIRDDVTTVQLALAVLALGAVTLLFGFLLVVFLARATVAPVHTVRLALSKVERGSLDTEIVVFDGTELGLLQSGFNRMVAGLRERERIRDLFGRHVGREVAGQAVQRQPELGGEIREVGVLFVDVVGSTALAATRPPDEVVTLLNRFFNVVVDEVHAYGGLVNKFEGDAALAVFGAPADVADPAGSALAAARAMGGRLTEEVPECAAGIGVAFGGAVAGNVGAESRFEYTVIGDPVNEAARLTDLSKDVPGRIVGSATAVENAEPTEATRWHMLDEQHTLRGRTESTRLAIPV